MGAIVSVLCLTATSVATVRLLHAPSLFYRIFELSIEFSFHFSPHLSFRFYSKICFESHASVRLAFRQVMVADVVAFKGQLCSVIFVSACLILLPFAVVMEGAQVPSVPSQNIPLRSDPGRQPNVWGDRNIEPAGDITNVQATYYRGMLFTRVL